MGIMTKFTFSAAIITTLFSAISTAQAKPCLFSQTMITGASVSAGLDGISFGDQLAEKYGTQKKLIHEAYSGVSGNAIIGYRSFSEKVKSASIVIAMDFFYWDQTTCGSVDWDAKVSKTIDTLFDKTVKNGIPLVLGNLIHGHEPFGKLRYEAACADVINQKLKAACDLDSKKCLMIDNTEVDKTIVSFFMPKTAGLAPAEFQKYIYTHVTRDGVHPRTDAYAVIADYLDQQIQASPLQCKQ
jgi:hypothetical protein